MVELFGYLTLLSYSLENENIINHAIHSKYNLKLKKLLKTTI